MTPRVTVLLAVHDGAAYVEEAVESVLDQTFEDFELLVVDDGSTDGTPDLVAGFGDERIRLLRNERNLGQAPSLNRGLREARGEYVARLDADDRCRPQRLERQVAVLDAEPGVALVGSWLELVQEEGRRIGWLRSEIAGYAEFVFHTLISRVLIAHPAAMFRRGLVLELGGYDESTAPAEDKDLWRRIALARGDARIVPEPLVVYRIHDAQLSQVKAAYQKRVDEESQERFLRALSSRAPARPVRLLLADDPCFWKESGTRTAARSAVGAVALLLEDAARALALSPAEASLLETMVAGRLLRVARRGWRANPARLWRAGPPLAGYARSRASLPAPLAAFAAAYALAPFLYGLWLGERRAARLVAATPALQRLRSPAKRSRLLRLLYSRLVSGT